MWVSDTSIKRPVFATVISLILLVAGVASYFRLSLREYPNIDPPVVSISTEYVGAAAATVESRITQIIEDRVAGIEGIRFIESTSEDGRSSVKLEFRLGRDIDAATSDVRDRVSRALPSLPPEIRPPDIQKVDANEDVIIWFNLASDGMTVPALTDYAERYLVDRFSSLDGVARVRIGGGQTYAMRIWLDKDKLAAFALTAADVEKALRRENVGLPAGVIESVERQFTLRVNRQFTSAEEFASLVVRADDKGLVRLGDLAQVEKSSVEYRNLFRGNGANMVGLGIVKQSTANTLDVARVCKQEVARLNKNLPGGMQLLQSYDSSVFIEEAIHEVYRTFAVAAALVILVIYLFLGSWRATLIPAVTVPVSLIATFSLLLMLDFSLNMLTLLALILSVGLVVDDAIVVLENIHRRMTTLGESALVAAFRGTRQVGFAVLATTFVLVAVFIPIAFVEGDLGRLFTEFAVTMSAAVLFSALVALTLSPVIAARLLTSSHTNNLLIRGVDSGFNSVRGFYQRILQRILHRPWIAGVILVASLAGCIGLYNHLPKEYAPDEDRGTFFVSVDGPEGASYAYMAQYMEEIEKRLMVYIDKGEVDRMLVRAPRNFSASATTFNTGIAIINLKPWGERRDAWAIMADIRKDLADLPGVRIAPIMRQGISSRSGKPIEVVIEGGTYETLAQWRDTLFKAINDNNPGFLALDSDYKQTSPQIKVDINYELAASLGVSVQSIGSTLETLLASKRASTFVDQGEEYDVLLEGRREQFNDPSDLANVQVRSDTTGALVPLGNLITLSDFADSKTLNRFNRNRAITIEANLETGFTQDKALAYIEQLVKTQLPETAILDYKGRSRAFIDASGASNWAFILGIVVMFLVLAAQFESYINPLVITLTVPLAIAGGLCGLAIAGMSLNLFSQVGLILLVGLAAKNGILIVEFANQGRDEGLSIEEAIRRAADTRLRPILMTNITALVGALPLIFTPGAGSETRSVLGVTLFSGVLVATVLTLCVVPLVYRLLAPFTHPPLAVTRKLNSALQDDA
ncbi:MAG TPA: efflux RND transporter permease subunit [Cellvibrionaceae bacterium]|nr:efflux RND transporter permease subunit [Cellvibrionaceae bacterium]